LSIAWHDPGSAYVELPQTDHAFDIFLPKLSPAAQAAMYDVDRFLAFLASGWERLTPGSHEAAEAALAAR
jgi:hypothetical protein